MNSAIFYLVYDPDPDGPYYRFERMSDAYDYWKDMEEYEQDYTALEIVPDEGTARDITSDFADWYAEDCREARGLEAHYASLAPCWRTHGG